MELTNGNRGEVEATPGMVNEAGYHGNVVLSKYPILQTKVVRLHRLDDYLYKSKTRNMDAGERRLGGRMALFATTLVGNTEFLLISMHTHAGSKKDLATRRWCLHQIS
jgi:endonuclease/exonuclease/phosphatase family metal-dependent hydrolase